MNLNIHQRKYLWGFVLFLIIVRIVAMIIVPFTDNTEARYAEMARKMLETGNWITPQFDYGVPFWGKPPLHTWLSVGGMGALGIHEFSARLPIFVCACGLLALVFFWVRAEKGADFALIGTSILASNLGFFVWSAVVMPDIPLVVGTTLSMVAFWNAMKTPKCCRLWGYIFFVGLALGLLAKGPISIFLVSLPVAVWLLLSHRMEEAWRSLPWISGMLLMFVIAAPWYVVAELRTPGFLEYFLIGEHFNRFFISGWTGDLYGNAHSKQYGTIWLFSAFAFLPWSIFFLRPLFRFRPIAACFRSDTSGWRAYLLLWMLSPLLIFTAASNITLTYVLPGFPAAAILLVQSWIDSERSVSYVRAGSARAFKLISVGFALFITITLFGYVVSPEFSAKTTQKRLIAAAYRVAPPDVSRIFYWRARFYSAEFYSAGKATQIGTYSELDTLVNNNSRDFLAVPDDKSQEVSLAYMNFFEKVGKFGNINLFFEKPRGDTDQPINR